MNIHGFRYIDATIKNKPSTLEAYSPDRYDPSHKSMKRKGKIELSKDSLIPNKREIWFTAFEKLDEANIGIQQMEISKDRISYENGWVRFVESLEEAWTSFIEEGKDVSTKFQPWMGKYIKERRNDPLLKYLYQARHQSQHGNISLNWKSGKIRIAPNFSGHIKSLKIHPDGNYEADATALHESADDFSLVHESGKPILPKIVNKKHNQEYAPPNIHLNKTIQDSLPHNVAKLAIQYYHNIFREALKKFKN